MLTRRRLITASSSLSLGLVASRQLAWAQGVYPSKPIRIVVPSPAGSPVDAVARKLGEHIGKSLGGTVVIDNKPGALGTIGAAEVARAPADGHTFLFSTSSPLVEAAAMLKAMPYDPRTGFSFISKVANSAPALVANMNVKANSLSELVAEMKAKGTSPTYGSWGPGTIPMQIMESASRQSGVKFREVPYKGSPPALQDMLAGAVDMTFMAPYAAVPMIAGGKLKALALVSDKRSSLLPNVQTFTEAGFSSFVFTNEVWVGLVGPAGLPSVVHLKIADAVRAAVQGPELKNFLLGIGFTPVGNTPAEFEKEHRAEFAAIPPLLRELGMTAQ